jgi:CrcB protein
MTGGALGTALRFGLGRVTQHPLGTLLSNIIACLVLGFLTAKLAALGKESPNAWRLFLGIGFCGGLSTFSTLMLELVQYQQQGNVLQGAGYLAASFGLGMAAVLVGMWAGG